MRGLYFGCFFQLLAFVLFVTFMILGVEVGPVLGTILWGVFFVGFLFYNIKDNKSPTADLSARNNSRVNHVSINNEIKSKPISTQVESEPRKKSFPLIQINYVPSEFGFYKGIYTYPVIIMPKPGAFIKYPKKGRRFNIGASENQFLEQLKYFFDSDFYISGEMHIKNKNVGQPFEPDIVLIRVKNRKNIFIDIEIDEPYDGVTKLPTHVMGKDSWRDQFFSNRGWIVIRFSERQAVEETKQCILLIVKIITQIDPEFTIHEELINTRMPSEDLKWNAADSQRMAEQKFRESYLGKEFYESKPKRNSLELLTLSDDEVEIENLNPDNDFVRHKNQTDFNSLLPDNQNSRLVFISETHKYFIDGNGHTLSVTELVELFFTPFDPIPAVWKLKNGKNWNDKNEYWGLSDDEIISSWQENNRLKAELGEKLHDQIDKYLKLNIRSADSVEFRFFLNFIKDHQGMSFIDSEVRIFDEQYLIAGTVDAIFRDVHGDYHLFDWKRSGKLNQELQPLFDKFALSGKGCLKHLKDSQLNKYSLQLNLYKFILEKNLGIEIKSMNIIVLHPNNEDYIKVPVNELKNETFAMLETIEYIRLK